MPRTRSSLCSLMLAAGLVPALARPADDKPAAIEGKWTAESAVRDGQAAGDVVGNRLSLTGGHFEIRSKDGELLYAGTFRASPSAKPAAIDFEHAAGSLKGKTWKGIYDVEGDTLTVCDNAPNLTMGRPPSFMAGKGSGYVLVTFRREQR